MGRFSEEFIESQKKRLKTRIKEHEKMIGGREIDAHLLFKRNTAIPNAKKALRLIEKGKYGLCIVCGEEIPIKRLKIMPAALKCIACQKREEDENAD